MFYNGRTFDRHFLKCTTSKVQQLTLYHGEKLQGGGGGIPHCTFSYGAPNMLIAKSYCDFS